MTKAASRPQTAQAQEPGPARRQSANGGGIQSASYRRQFWGVERREIRRRAYFSLLGAV